MSAAATPATPLPQDAAGILALAARSLFRIFATESQGMFLVDAGGRMHRIGHRLDQAAWMRIGGEGPHAGDAALLHHGVEIAPMGGMRFDDGHRRPRLPPRPCRSRP